MKSRKVLALRDYQQQQVDDVREQFASGHRRVLLQSPTGSGKTVVFSHIARTSAQIRKKVLILAHRIELLEQCGDKLYCNYVDFGYLSPKYSRNMGALVQVGSIDTVIGRMRKMNFYPDLIIIDEAHRSAAATYQAIINYYEKAYVLGVTATPIRTDGRPLGDTYERLILGPTVQWLIDSGYLIKPTYIRDGSSADYSGAKLGKDGDISRKDRASKTNDARITGDAIIEYETYSPGAPAVAFCEDINHSKDVAAQFQKAGWNFIHIDGKSKGRKKLLSAVESGKYHGFTCVDLATEGLDMPILQTMIGLRKTLSLGLWFQMVGRIMRTADGKQFAWVLDHTGNYNMHGATHWEVDWTLEGEEKTPGTKRGSGTHVRTKQCSHCDTMNPKNAVVCINCQNIFFSNSGLPEANESVRLQPVTEEEDMMLRLHRAQEITNAQTLEELEAIGKARGYWPGWALNKWNSRNNNLNIV